MNTHSKFSYRRSVELLREAFAGESELYVFDFDMTLAISKARILKIDSAAPGGKRPINQQEFDADSKKPGGYREEDYDFSEFQTNLEFTPIIPLIDKMQELLESGKEVVILTARSKELGIAVFLSQQIKDTINLENVETVLVNRPQSGLEKYHTDFEKKAAWLSSKLSNGQYRKVEIWDDSESNVKSFQQMRTQFPDVEIKVHLVKFDQDKNFIGTQLVEEDFQETVKKNHAKKKHWLIGNGGNNTKTSYKIKPSYKRSKSAPPGAGGT